MGFMTAILGAASSAASASSSVASETMQASESGIASAVQNGGFASRAAEAAAAEAADDTMDIQKAAEQSALANSQSEPKNFFSRAWDESKQAVGIGGNGGSGAAAYNLAKTAVAKGDSSEPQRMEPAPVQTSAPSVPAANAEDELNKLRNRMNVS